MDKLQRGNDMSVPCAVTRIERQPLPDRGPSRVMVWEDDLKKLEALANSLRTAIEAHREQWCRVNPADENNVRPADWKLWEVLVES